ncbi:hyaluronan and proteoglycan link protein 2 isoform X2 [Homo sapiens]|uniref:cDNA FLJ52064 n=1 Tax=Homo sapiens TaxID=9606 RepID=B7Z1R1_HUMAN|nr:hyaluronan and proteoglycan link protein 2 isoform X2 [Homo sapiens]XP_054188831.1 hyaluronan and proteoglycan link protein 2 isoform X2 [Homo sapiens]XP_054194050.1 hyaluronan and proteoglycan link protein 2 isoform X2 [Homo sapiens]BAH11597.1 unnamed protein product [Homo sapiens]
MRTQAPEGRGQKLFLKGAKGATVLNRGSSSRVLRCLELPGAWQTFIQNLFLKQDKKLLSTAPSVSVKRPASNRRCRADPPSCQAGSPSPHSAASFFGPSPSSTKPKETQLQGALEQGGAWGAPGNADPHHQRTARPGVWAPGRARQDAEGASTRRLPGHRGRAPGGRGPVPLRAHQRHRGRERGADLELGG